MLFSMGRFVFICLTNNSHRELQLCYFTRFSFRSVLSCLLKTPTMEHLSTVPGISVNSLRWGWEIRSGEQGLEGYQLEDICDR